MTRLSVALGLLTATACASRVAVPPTPFAESDAFKKVRKDALGFLDRDFNADGVLDAVVVTRSGPGMVAQVFVQNAGPKGGVWSHACTGPVLLGEELDTLRWVQPGERELLLMVASTDNPDTLTQSFALLPASAPCTPVFQEQVSLEKPGYDRVSPGEVPGGVLVDDAGRVHVIDRAKTVQLAGAIGEIEVLTAVRERILDDDGVRITVTERPHGFVEQRPLKVLWRSSTTADEKALPELTDEKAGTMFTAAAGEEGVLEIESLTGPIVILDVAHGCSGEARTPLTLTPDTAAADTHVVGTPPGSSSFVQGVGHRPQANAGEHRDVLMLREPVNKLALRVGPPDSARCLHDVRAYGFL